MEDKSIELHPLGWKTSLILLLAVSVILRVTHYVFVPAYTTATGKPYLVGYLMGWMSTMFLIFAASLLVYKLDGHSIHRKAFVERYRLNRMERKDWIWTGGMVVFAILSLGALSFTQKFLRSIPLFAPHPLFPPDMVGFVNHFTPGMLFGMPLEGKWWIAGVYFIGWVLNIVGEEWWYRGWMLPRQEIAFGSKAWLVNGLMFNFQHTFQPWNLLALLPGSLFVSYAVQRRQKTWMSIIWHGVMNVSLLILVIQGVIG